MLESLNSKRKELRTENQGFWTYIDSAKKERVTYPEHNNLHF